MDVTAGPMRPPTVGISDILAVQQARIAELEAIIRGITYSMDGKVHVSFYAGADLLGEFPALAEIHSKGK